MLDLYVIYRVLFSCIRRSYKLKVWEKYIEIETLIQGNKLFYTFKYTVLGFRHHRAPELWIRKSVL